MNKCFASFVTCKKPAWYVESFLVKSKLIVFISNHFIAERVTLYFVKKETGKKKKKQNEYFLWLRNNASLGVCSRVLNCKSRMCLLLIKKKKNPECVCLRKFTEAHIYWVQYLVFDAALHRIKSEYLIAIVSAICNHH